MLILYSGMVSAQDGRGDIRFVFYNVENLFDPFDDSLTQDEEFLPGGMRHWTWEKYLHKEGRIYKVLASIGAWRPPEIIGLCEVENRFVLNWLTRKTPLLKYNYRVIHRDSPDERGIDLAILYLPQYFKPLQWKFIQVKGGRSPTRDVLYVMGSIPEGDTLHLILCHWPSRWDGYLESLPDRIAAAQLVRRLADSVFQTDPSARILVAGDMNDELTDPSLSRVLRVQQPGRDILDSCLYNTGVSHGITSGNRAGKTTGMPWGTESNIFSKNSGIVSGTIKYQGNLYEFDHIFASGSFFSDTGLYVNPGGKRIFAPGFLLEKDGAGQGSKPYRTFNGYKYIGGFSDHLPVYIDIWRRQ